MIIKYSQSVFKTLKKCNVRVRNSFKHRILLFSRNVHDPILRNHPLHGEWNGYRSIDITADWRALYKEIKNGETTAFFSYLGTHKELYGW